MQSPVKPKAEQFPTLEELTDAIKAENPPAPEYMQNRELSWLTFNERCLDQATDPAVPLLERLQFISIFCSNLREFFMVRVGSLTDLSLIEDDIRDNKTLMTPAQQLDLIYARARELYAKLADVYRDLSAELAEVGIVRLGRDDLNDTQRKFLEGYLEDNINPYLSPQVVNSRHPFPQLENGRPYIVVRLVEKDDDRPGDVEDTDLPVQQARNDKKGKGAKGATLGLIALPSQCDQIIELPGKGFQFMLLEDAVEFAVPSIFDMYRIKHTNIICVTRNADLDANEGLDENEFDYREHMKRILKKRARLTPVRLETRRKLSNKVTRFLLKRLGLKPYQVYAINIPLDMGYAYDLPEFLKKSQRKKLLNPPHVPAWPAAVGTDHLIEQALDHDIILSYPYESMDPFVHLLREAATDPDVISIRITLYRLARHSSLAEALIHAAENGKQVTALCELRARFDESSNIEWSQRFEEAGVEVIYGFLDYKVHSKICSITRKGPDGPQHITQLGTGNYNEKTARLYTDFSCITSDEQIGDDATEFFHNMGTEAISDDYQALWVAPLQIKENIIAGIDEQIELARAGKSSGLFFKSNSVTDKEIICKLVEASQAGVPVTLFVRGICCLVPGIVGYSENIRVVSIIGRFLEHSRIYGFGPDLSSMRLYLSSADLMTRNMEKRVEVAWPVTDEAVRAEVCAYIDIMLQDTAKLRELLSDTTYTPLYAFAVDEAGNPVNPVNAQEILAERAATEHSPADMDLDEDALFGYDAAAQREWASDTGI